MVWVAVQKGFIPAKTDVMVRRMCWAESSKKLPYARKCPPRSLSMEALFFGDHRKNEDLIHALAFRKNVNDSFVPAERLVHLVEEEDLRGFSLEKLQRHLHRAPGHYFPSQLLRSAEPVNILLDMGNRGIWPMKRDYRSHMGQLIMNVRKGSLDSLAINELSFFDVDYDELRNDFRYHFGGLHLAAMIVVLADLEECIKAGKTECYFETLDEEAVKDAERNKRRLVYKRLDLEEGFLPKFLVINHRTEYIYVEHLVRCLPQPRRSPLPSNSFRPMDAGLRVMMESHGDLSSSPTEAGPSPPASSPATEPEEVLQRGSQSPLACLDEEIESEEESPCRESPPPPPPPPAQEIPIDLGEALLWDDDYLYLRTSSSSYGERIVHPLSELWAEDPDGPM